MRNLYYIFDETITSAFKEAGISCEPNENGVTVNLSEREWPPKDRKLGHWYDIALALEPREIYTLPGGRNIVRFGTALIWKSEREAFIAELKQSRERKLVDDAEEAKEYPQNVLHFPC